MGSCSMCWPKKTEDSRPLMSARLISIHFNTEAEFRTPQRNQSANGKKVSGVCTIITVFHPSQKRSSFPISG